MAVYCKCGCCHEPIFDPNEARRLPCGAEVCEVCYVEDFDDGKYCPQRNAGESPDCLNCIFALVEAGPEYLLYSDADPGL